MLLACLKRKDEEIEMRRPWIILLIFMLLFVSCSVMKQTLEGTVKTEITDPDGQEWIVVSKDDALVTMTKKMKEHESVEITVDNRGKPSAWAAFVQLLMMRTTLTVGEKDND